MKIFSSLFDLRDKPKNSTAGSSYRFFTGGSTAGKNVIKCSAMPMTERQSNKTQREPLIKWLCYADYQVVCYWCRGSSRPNKHGNYDTMVSETTVLFLFA